MTAPRAFCVALHDVTPVFARQVEAVLDALRPLVGRAVSAAVVPDWHGRAREPRDAELWSLVRERCDEVLLHGLRHHQPRRRPLAALTFHANEFSYLTEEEASARLAAGQDAMEELLGFRARGFLPPAFARGRVTRRVLEANGLAFRVGATVVDSVRGRVASLATWAWDFGPIPGAGRLGELGGHALRILRPSAVPCIALHPVDVDRGYLERALAIVRSLGASGYEARTFDALVAGRSGAP